METNGIGILLLGWSSRLFARILSGGKSALEAAGTAIIFMVADTSNPQLRTEGALRLKKKRTSPSAIRSSGGASTLDCAPVDGREG